MRDKEQQVTRASVFVHSNASWQDLSVVITRTTVTDFEKIVDKLKVFFDEQFKSGGRLMSVHAHLQFRNDRVDV